MFAFKICDFGGTRTQTAGSSFQVSDMVSWLHLIQTLNHLDIGWTGHLIYLQRKPASVFKSRPRHSFQSEKVPRGAQVGVKWRVKHMTLTQKTEACVTFETVTGPFLNLTK